jgi:hypothetical protein
VAPSAGAPSGGGGAGGHRAEAAGGSHAGSKRKAMYETLFFPLSSRGFPVREEQERRALAASGQSITRRRSSST